MDGEMSIKGYVDSAEVDAKLGGSDNKAFIEKVARGMKENPVNVPTLTLGLRPLPRRKRR